MTNEQFIRNAYHVAEIRDIPDVVIVELSLNGTHKGPLELPKGIVPPSGKRMKAPCCDVFRLKNGKIQSFHCYPVVNRFILAS